MARPSGRALRIIYVDDDTTNQKVVAAMLEAVSIQTICCKSPLEALELLSIEAFDAALIDIHMPEMSGIELLHRLRRQIGPNRGMPALAITADLNRDERNYRELGFDAFVAKPVMLKVLLASLLGVLSAASKANAAGRTAPQLAAHPA